MDTDKEILLKELKRLRAEEFNDFKFYLEEYGSKVQGAFSKDTETLRIAPCDLENADRRKTVDLIVHTYSSQPLEVAREVLEKVGRHDVMESLKQSDRGERLTQRVHIKTEPPAEPQTNSFFLNGTNNVHTILKVQTENQV